MAATDETYDDYLWEIESIAFAYEAALKQEVCPDSIESLLASNLLLPRTELLTALIETELDVFGTHRDSLSSYLKRFPSDATLLHSIFGAPLDIVRPPLSEGEHVASYRVGRLLGKGAIGYVYQAFDTQSDTSVAIKILRPDRLTTHGGFYRDFFRNEATIGGSLDHPRIVKLLVSGEHAGLPYHVFQFVEGLTLREFCRKHRPNPLLAARIAADVAEAIHYSHLRGIVHRDLKPSNIIVDRSGSPFVTDFGLALSDSQQGSGARIAGTPQYMSPEQLKGDADLVDGRSDIYSLGVILYEALAGVHPSLGHASPDRELNEALIIKPATPLRQRVKVSPWLEQICMKSLEKDPSQRFSTASDLAHALRHYVLMSRVKKALPPMGLAAVLLAIVFFALPTTDMFRKWNATEALWNSASPRVNSASSSGTQADDRLNDPQLASPLSPSSLQPLLAKGIPNLSTTEAENAAKLIVADLRDNPSEENQYWQYFAGSEDNTLQSALVQYCAIEGLHFKSLIQRIERETNASIRCAMLLALGEYSVEQIPQAERERLLPELFNTYCSDRRASIHSSVEWLLRRWGFEDALKKVDRQQFHAQPVADLEWYTVLPDITMVACDTSEESVPTESVRFAISTHELAVRQWSWNLASLPPAPTRTIETHSQNFRSWHECAAFCNKLSERAGFPRSEFCYEQLPGTYYRPYADALLRRGFRMPTLAEWTFAARAHTQTPRYWGRQDRLLPEYAICRPHSRLKRVASGTLKPNGLGLFDALGNVSEWMHDTAQPLDPSSATAERPIRGGSAWTAPGNVRVDGEYFMPATEPSERMGLRLAQSLLPVPTNDDSFNLTLQTEQEIELIQDSIKLAEPMRKLHPQTVTQTLLQTGTTFLGRVLRGETTRRSLHIQNRTPRTLTIEQVAITGCVEVADSSPNNITLSPAASLSIPLRVKQISIGTQRGQVAIYWSEPGRSPQKSEYDLAAYISGPAVAAIEGPLDADASIQLDFGTVAPRTQLQQLITLLNLGDKTLILSEATGSGTLTVVDDPTPVSLPANRHAYFELRMDTNQTGEHNGSIKICTNDPLTPVVKINAKMTVKDLPRIPMIGLYRDGTWLLDSNQDGASEQSVQFGEKGDQPLAGDFDGDGVAELAVVHRNADGKLELHIRSLRDEAERITVRQLDVSEGRIVVGDYDGDGKCDVAWVSLLPNTVLLSWQIDIDGDSRWDESFSYGFPTDIPMLGDWNGDGKADAGTLRRNPNGQATNFWYLNGIGVQGAYREVHYGLPADIPLVADWNGDGRTDIGVYRMSQGTGRFLLDLDFDPASERLVHFGLLGDIPIAFMTSPQ